jgi:hypothetical protein
MIKLKTLYHTAVLLSVTAIILLTMVACSEQQPAVEKPRVKEKNTETPVQSEAPKKTETPKQSGKMKAPVIINDPIYDAMVDGPFLVKGDTSDADGVLYYTFDDGHNVLASGSIDAKDSTDGRKTFEFTLAFAKPTSPYGILAIYDENPDDGRKANLLSDTRVQFPMEFLAD